MAPRPPLPTRAVLVAPSWMAGGRPTQHLSSSGLRSSPAPGAPDQWQVQTEESYLRQHPDLVSVEHLAGPGAPTPHRLERLRDAQQAALLDDAAGTRIAEASAMQERARSTEQLVDGLVAWQAATQSSPIGQLPRIAAGVQAALLAMRIRERPEAAVMDSAGVHLLRRSPRLVHRAKLCLLLLQADRDPLLRAGDVAAIQAVLDAGDTVFAASQDLYQGLFLGEVYLAPLLGALSPAVWGFCAPRGLGIVVYTLGQPLLGHSGNAVELLQTLPQQGAEPDPDREQAHIPTLSPRAGAAALDWWTRRLDDLFGVLTDPALATDRTGVYLPAKQAHTLLSAEQLFRRVTSIQAAHRDAHARRVLLFTVLDTLERLSGRPVTTLGSAAFARRRLDELTATIPDPAAEILLPGAERAVEALERLQRGFFRARQLGHTSVEIPEPDGSTRDVELDRATAYYLKILRDATHGHGGNTEHRTTLTNALLAQHNGQIPHDLGLLGYLYLLDLLAHTDDLAHRVYGGGRS